MVAGNGHPAPHYDSNVLPYGSFEDVVVEAEVKRGVFADVPASLVTAVKDSPLVHRKAMETSRLVADLVIASIPALVSTAQF